MNFLRLDPDSTEPNQTVDMHLRYLIEAFEIIMKTLCQNRMSRSLNISIYILLVGEEICFSMRLQISLS